MRKYIGIIALFVAMVLIFMFISQPLTLYSQRTTPTLTIPSSSAGVFVATFEYSSATWVGAQTVVRLDPALYVDNNFYRSMDACTVKNTYVQSDETITVWSCPESLDLADGSHTIGVIAAAYRQTDSADIVNQCGGTIAVPDYYSDGVCSSMIEADKISSSVEVTEGASAGTAPSGDTPASSLPTGSAVKTVRANTLSDLIQSFINTIRGWFN